MSSRAKDTGFLRNLITYDGSGNITLPALLYISTNKEVATKEYVDAQNSSQVLQSRTLTINGVTYDLSANRSWTIDSMVYPSAGIALSSGTGWGTSVVNNSANWNTAYGWGNHALAGYLTSFTETDPIWISEKVNYYTKTQSDSRYLQSFTETDPVWIADKPSYATKTYVDTSISSLVDAAPTTLNTLNELAAALGDDPNFATSISTLIGTKEPAITAGTTTQYWRGDKTWQTLPVYTLASLGAEPAIAAGTTSQYWRGDKTWQTLNTTSVTEGTNLYYTQARFDSAFNGKSTTNLAEGTNLYFTTARARSAFSAGTNISIDANGVITGTYSYSLPTATASVLGGVKIGSGVTITSGVISVSTNYEAPIAAGTTAQYWRGDKTWQTLNSTAVGLSNVSNVAQVTTTYNTSLNSDSRNSRGVTRLYRRDDDSDFSVQTYWTGSYWFLRGYNGDTFHAEVQVAYADSAAYATNGRYSYDNGLNGGSVQWKEPSQLYVYYARYAGSIEWSQVVYRPTALSEFTNDLGNYGGWMPTSGGTFTGPVNANGTFFNVSGYMDITGPMYLRGNLLYLNAAGTAWNNFAVRNGEGYNLYATAYYENSDIRYKNIIETNPDISGLGIDVIKFTRHGSDIVRYGYSAQQVQALIPEAVEGTDNLTVNYMDVHTLKIASLERRVKELEERLKNTL